MFCCAKNQTDQILKLNPAVHALCVLACLLLVQGEMVRCVPDVSEPGSSAPLHPTMRAHGSSGPGTDLLRSSLPPSGSTQAVQQAPLQLRLAAAPLLRRPKPAANPPHSTAAQLLPSLPDPPPTKAGNKRLNPANNTARAVKQKTSEMGCTQEQDPGLTVPRQPSIPATKPKAAAGPLTPGPRCRVRAGAARESYTPLPKLGRPSKGTIHTAVRLKPAGTSKISLARALSAGGTGRAYDAGHSEGYWMFLGLQATPVFVYRSLSGALAICLPGCVTACGVESVKTTISNMLRYGCVGTPWVSRVWHANCNIKPGGPKRRQNFARVDAALELLQHYWLNTQSATKRGLRGVEVVLAELVALVGVVSHLSNSRFLGLNTRLIRRFDPAA